MNRRAFIHLLVLSVLLGACGKEAKLAAIPPAEAVLAFGDSVTYGTGASSDEDWPTLLADKTGWNITNAGIPGDTAEAGKGRIRALLEEHRPRLVIIEIGGNDFLRRRSQQAVKEDIRSIIGTVRQSGAQAVLVAVPELSLFGMVAGRPGDAAIYEELAAEEGVPLVSDLFSDILGQPDLRADQIHPNAEGYRQMASGIYTALQKVGLVRSGKASP